MRNLFDKSSLFSYFMYLNSMLMVAQTLVRNFLPAHVQTWLYAAAAKLLFGRSTEDLTVTINEFAGGDHLYSRNEVYEAAEIYLPTKISPKTKHICISKTSKEAKISVTFEDGEVVSDEFRGVELKWRFCKSKQDKPNKSQDYHGHHQTASQSEKSSFRLQFAKKEKDLILNSYIPSMIEISKRMRAGERVLKIHTLDGAGIYRDGGKWKSVNLDHPSSFDTLALEPALKNSIVRDLDRFRGRKEYYKRVGRAWKRGYLLYGPPGTGKSSLIAAMANHLKFDIYDLQLTAIRSDSELRLALLATANRSILVIEDIDCSCDLPERKKTKAEPSVAAPLAPVNNNGQKRELTLAGLLNFIDGLWSSCGDERVIVFTTNHKEKLDPALLRPGRMDMHIHLSYCTKPMFEELAANYLGGSVDVETHRLCAEIGELIDDQDVMVTPAKVAEKLMESEDPDVALDALLDLLKDEKKKKKKKKTTKKKANDEDGDDGTDSSSHLC